LTTGTLAPQPKVERNKLGPLAMQNRWAKISAIERLEFHFQTKTNDDSAEKENPRGLHALRRFPEKIERSRQLRKTIKGIGRHYLEKKGRTADSLQEAPRRNLNKQAMPQGSSAFHRWRGTHLAKGTK